MVFSPEKAASEFKRYYSVSDVNVETISNILRQQGFYIVKFNPVSNDEDVTNLINALNLWEYVRSTNGFTYADKNYRIVFVNENLSSEEELLVLAHEEGHIYLEHLERDSICGKDVIQEHDANEFVHYLFSSKIL